MAKIILFNLINILWKIIGWNMYKTTKFMNLMSLLIITLLIVTATLGLLVPILGEINTTTLADSFESVGPHYEVIIKMIITKFSIKEINSLLNVIKSSFWPMDIFGKNIERQMLYIDKFITKSFKTYIYAMLTCCSIICLRPWISENSIYPLAVYHILDVNDRKQYLFMYIWQVLNFIFGGTLLLAVDGLFILFITNIYCQLKLIKYGYRSLNINKISSDFEEDKVYQKMKVYVKHHNMILRFIKDVTKLFSLQILNQFVGNTASICMGVYIFTEAGTEEFSAAVKAITIILLFSLELTFFCTAGTFITNACLDVGDAMWLSGWDRFYNKRLRYATQMIIMRSQKREILRAGKLFAIDLTSLAAVLKTSVSVYTLMNNVKSKLR